MSLELDKPVHPLVEEVTQTAYVEKLVRTFTHGQLDKRRLDICVGSYGFELMSGGSRAQVEEHAARSLVYAKLHGLELVFAVHFIVQRVTTHQQPVTFPTWPAIPKANEQVPLVRSCEFQPLAKFILHVAVQVGIALALRVLHGIVCENLSALFSLTACERPD